MVKHLRRKVTRTQIALMLGVELVFAVFLWQSCRTFAKQGFLIKSGTQYILAWQREDKSTETSSFINLNEALRFASQELHLKPGKNPHNDNAIESIWTRKDMEKVVVFWKTIKLPYVNRLTFHEPEEAAIFETGFRHGAYSASPIGHSLSMVPITSN